MLPSRGDDGRVVSRRQFLAGAAAGVVVAGGAAVELAPARIRYRLGLAHSPDRHEPVSHHQIVSGTFASAHMNEPVGWSIALPAGAATGVVYCLHGYGESHTTAFSELHIPDVVAAAGAPLAVAACDGGSDSYWHPRRDGTDAMAMFFDEFIPLVEGRVANVQQRALLGWSMGGYGALLFAEQRPELFRAVAAGSPALWTRPGTTAPGAFDSATDYHRWDVYAGVGRLDGLSVRVDCGTDDPFVVADRAFVTRLRGPHDASFSYGFHDAAYWRSVAPAQIRTITASLSPE
jgi:S-formylglutathione hydrolase FrmB